MPCPVSHQGLYSPADNIVRPNSPWESTSGILKEGFLLRMSARVTFSRVALGEEGSTIFRKAEPRSHTACWPATYSGRSVRCSSTVGSSRSGAWESERANQSPCPSPHEHNAVVELARRRESCSLSPRTQELVPIDTKAPRTRLIRAVRSMFAIAKQVTNFRARFSTGATPFYRCPDVD